MQRRTSLHPYASPHSPRTRPSRYRRVKPAKWPTPGIKANRQSDTQSYLIFPETSHWPTFCRCYYGSIFIQICAVDSKWRIFSATECVLGVQGHPRSSMILVPLICDFLFVPHCDYCDYGPVLHRFWDTPTYWLKLPIFLPVSHSAPPLPMSPLEFRGEVKPQETRVMGLFYSKDPIIVAWVVLTWYQTVTDRQTDGRNLSWLIQRST